MVRSFLFTKPINQSIKFGVEKKILNCCLIEKSVQDTQDVTQKSTVKSDDDLTIQVWVSVCGWIEIPFSLSLARSVLTVMIVEVLLEVIAVVAVKNKSCSSERRIRVCVYNRTCVCPAAVVTGDEKHCAECACVWCQIHDDGDRKLKEISEWEFLISQSVLVIIIIN